LGSLATTGAAETLAYLPRCDLGVVLIDAGSTLTAEDLSTIQALNEAAISTAVLLSKADLLDPADAGKSAEYIGQQIRSHLRMEIAVHAVSVQPGFTYLLDRWFEEEIAPLHERRQQLTAESLKRKIGALRDAVAGVLTARLNRADSRMEAREPLPQAEAAEAEAKLRRISARFEEVREEWFRHTLDLREYGPALPREAAARIVDAWRASASAAPVTWESLSALATSIAAEKAGAIRSVMEQLARDLAVTIREVSSRLEDDGASAAEELSSVVKEMPRIDLGAGDLFLTPPRTIKLSRALAVRSVESQLRAAAGAPIEEAFATYASMLDAWSRRVAGELQLKFNSYADAHRARLARLSAPDSGGDSASIMATLREIGASGVEADAPSAVGAKE